MYILHILGEHNYTAKGRGAILLLFVVRMKVIDALLYDTMKQLAQESTRTVFQSMRNLSPQ